MELRILEYKGTSIQFEVKNGVVMANATMMAKPFSKKPSDCFKTEQMQRYISKLSEATKIIEADLINVENGNGTWIHEKLILKLAQWLDVDFEIWCDEQIATLLREEKVELKPKPKTRLELAKENVELIQELEAKDEILALQAPKMRVFDRVLDGMNTYTLDTVSDTLNIGRTTLAKYLETKKWKMVKAQGGTASTRYAETQGYAKTIFETIEISNNREKKVKKIVLTKKGLDKLISEL